MNKFQESLEMYLQSQISKVGALIKGSEDRLQYYHEYLKETKSDNTKKELSNMISYEINQNELLTFRLNWLIKQVRILEDEMMGYTE